MKVSIVVEIDDEDQWSDPQHEMGITEEAYLRLSGWTEEYGDPPLTWLGDVVDVMRLVG